MVYNIDTIRKGQHPMKGENIMGLDQYLYLEKYESECNWRKKEKCSYPKDLKDLGDKILARNFKSKTTRYQVGYWRKFNALQGWFEREYDVDSVARGVYVSMETLEKLLSICKIILKDLEGKPILTDENGEEYYDCPVALEFLPPTTGFFYGSQLIDEWYKKDLEYTVELFEDVLKIVKEKNYGIYYDASW
jgi:hypothetical protein